MKVRRKKLLEDHEKDENGKLKVAGESFEEIIGSKVSAKSGLNVRMSPNLKSKTIGKLLYGIPVTVESKKLSI